MITKLITVRVWTFHRNVHCRFLIPDYCYLLSCHKLSGGFIIHVGILHKVKCFRALVCRELRNVWDITESSDAEDHKVYYMNLFATLTKSWMVGKLESPPFRIFIDRGSETLRQIHRSWTDSKQKETHMGIRFVREVFQIDILQLTTQRLGKLKVDLLIGKKKIYK